MIREIRPLDESQRREAKQIIALAHRLARRRVASMLIDGVHSPMVARNMLREALHNLELKRRLLDDLWAAVDRGEVSLGHHEVPK
jgi:hypothetical protein